MYIRWNRFRNYSRLFRIFVRRAIGQSSLVQRGLGKRRLESCAKRWTFAKFWIKVIRENKVPINVLFDYKIPLSAEPFFQVFSPKSMKDGTKWDLTWVDNESLETYPNGGVYVTTCKANQMTTPLSDRDFVGFLPPEKEIDWFGKRAFIAELYTPHIHRSRPT